MAVSRLAHTALGLGIIILEFLRSLNDEMNELVESFPNMLGAENVSGHSGGFELIN